ncbi:MAG: SRPBCC domain-containing protein [Acidobacteriaceae bacterium]
MLAGKSVSVEAYLPSEREIAFSCVFQRSAQTLFEAWTTPEHLRRWWGCEGSTITHCAIDLRIGGPWSLVMRMADGSNHPFHGTYREIARPNRLVYTEQYEMPQFGNPEWLTTVTFEEIAGGTRLTHVIQHKSRAVRDAHLQAGMQEGMIQTLTRLDQHTAALELK